MLTVEERMEIAVLQKHGESIHGIARAMGVSWNTLRRYLRAATARCVSVGHRRWVAAAPNPLPRSVIAGNRPQITFLGPATSRIEYRAGRFIGEEFR